MAMQMLTQDDDGYAVTQRRPRTRPPSFSGSQVDLRNSRSMNNLNRVSYQPSMVHSVFPHVEEHLIPPASSEHDKSKMTRRYFATIFAISYAIFLVIFGAIAFIGDAVSDRYHPIPEVFCIFMLSVGMAYFLFLYIDIRIHVKGAKAAVKEKERRIQAYNDRLAKSEGFQFQGGPMELTHGQNGTVTNRQMMMPDMGPELYLKPIKPQIHKYCFVTGRHGEFLYLKLGAAWFAFGLLIHSILNLTYQILFLTSTDPNLVECANVYLVVVEVMFPLYSLLVLFFIFKYMNIIINENRGLARIALMHAIGTSLAFWIFTIVRETSDAIALSKSKNMYKDAEETSVKMSRIYAEVERYNTQCPGNEDLNLIFRTFSPYLYPFIIEFCILIVGIFYMLWSNISRCPKKLSASGHGHEEHNEEHGNGKLKNDHHNLTGSSASSDHCKNLTEHDDQYRSSSFIYADCHASNRGLFAGLILMILTIVFIILFFVAVSEDAYIDIGITMDSIFELTVLVVLIVAVLLAYFQTTKLDINQAHISKLDDVLLFIAIPAFFSETIFSMVPAVANVSILNICVILAQLLQILIQTPFLCDALRRCSNSIENRKKKPGRELVMFLTIANVSLWIYYTFSVKNADTKDERYTYYGYTVWSILNHLSLPLIMFYRFHASVCLVDIWRHSYEPGESAHH